MGLIHIVVALAQWLRDERWCEPSQCPRCIIAGVFALPGKAYSSPMRLVGGITP